MKSAANQFIIYLLLVNFEIYLFSSFFPSLFCASLQDIWNDLVEKDLSFVVYDRNTNRVIGTALNFDARNEPEVDVKSKLIIVFEFLEYVEGPIR